jgi:hypothetical protein
MNYGGRLYFLKLENGARPHFFSPFSFSPFLLPISSQPHFISKKNEHIKMGIGSVLDR